MSRVAVHFVVLTVLLSEATPLVGDTGKRGPGIRIDTSEGLMANIGRSGIKLILAPESTDPGGHYTIPPCEEGIDERSTNQCGQLQQGDNSTLTGGLDLEVDRDRVPTGRELSRGAVIDCGGLPPDRTLSCIAAGDNSTIERLTIENGTPPTPRGSEHRVGILILAEKHVRIREVVVRNTHRAILMKGESGRKTRARISGSLVDGTELAGFFVMGLSESDTPVSDAEYRVRLESNRLTSIGLHPILVVSFSALRTQMKVDIIDSVVEPLTLRGISVFTARGFDDVPARQNTTAVSIRGGRLIGGAEGSQVLGGVGLAMQNFNRGSVTGTDNNDNTVSVVVRGLEFVNLASDLQVNYAPDWGRGNTGVLAMKRSSHSDTVGGTTVGVIRKVADDAGNDWVIDGSQSKFNRRNEGFDTSAVSDDFEK